MRQVLVTAVLMVLLVPMLIGGIAEELFDSVCAWEERGRS